MHLILLRNLSILKFLWGNYGALLGIFLEFPMRKELYFIFADFFLEIYLIYIFLNILEKCIFHPIYATTTNNVLNTFLFLFHIVLTYFCLYNISTRNPISLCYILHVHRITGIFCNRFENVLRYNSVFRYTHSTRYDRWRIV